MTTIREFSQSYEGKKYIYLIERFLKEVISEIKEGKHRTYEKNFTFKYEDYEFNLEFRQMDKIIFYSHKGGKRITFLFFNRNNKTFHGDERHLQIGSSKANLTDSDYFAPVFKKIKQVDLAVARANKTTLEIVFEEDEFETLGLLKAKEELTKLERDNLFLQELYQLKTSLYKKEKIEKKTKEKIVEKINYLIEFFKEEQKFSQERNHDLTRLVKEDLPNLINTFLKLDDELKSEQEKAFLEALEMVFSVTKEKEKEVKLSEFEKTLTLFKKRYA